MELDRFEFACDVHAYMIVVTFKILKVFHETALNKNAAFDEPYHTSIEHSKKKSDVGKEASVQ